MSVPDSLTQLLIFGRQIPMLSTAQQRHQLQAQPAVDDTKGLLTCAVMRERSEVATAQGGVHTVLLDANSARNAERERAALDAGSAFWRTHRLLCCRSIRPHRCWWR